MRKIGPFSVLIVCLPLLMGAEVYRWVDSNGVVNYTQIKPHGVNAQQLQTRGGGPTIVTDPKAATDIAAGPTPEQQRLRTQLNADEQTRRVEMAQIKQENCTMAPQHFGATDDPQPGHGNRRQRR